MITSGLLAVVCLPVLALLQVCSVPGEGPPPPPVPESLPATRQITTPLYVVDYHLTDRVPVRISYTVLGRQLPRPQDERNGPFWLGNIMPDSLLKTEAHNGSGYDIGHLRAWLLSGGSPEWRWCNWLGSCAPMHPTLNRGVFAQFERRIYQLVREHGEAGVEIRILPGELEQFPRAEHPCRVPRAFWCQIHYAGQVETYLFPNSAAVRGQPLASFRVSEAPPPE